MFSNSCIGSIRFTTQKSLNTIRTKLVIAGTVLVSFASTAQTVSIGSPMDGLEGASDASLLVSIDGGAVNNTGSAITGTINFSGDAISGMDYMTPPSTFSIPHGAASALITFSVIDDPIIELDEEIVATISSLSAGTIGNAMATATIEDDDVSNIYISLSTVMNGIEGTQDIKIAVSLDNGLINMAGFPISGIVTFGGTALSGVDFIATNPIDFTIGYGENADTIVVPVIDDAVYEGTETVVFRIKDLYFGGFGNQSTSTEIIDNDINTAGNNELTFGASSEVEVITYPNPMEASLILKANEPLEQYLITDLTGKVISSGSLNQAEVELNVSDLPKGSYLLTLTTSNGKVMTKRVLKK